MNRSKEWLLTAAAMVCIVLTAQAQLQNSNWRFAYSGGLNFSTTGSVNAVTGETATQEGGACVSDRTTGAMLFYTDGNTLWNANNVPMLNGTGLLGGEPSLLSSTTAASIVRQPDSETRYYVFTIDQQDSPNGLRYSMVDMTLDGGLGGVVQNQKNIPVFTTNSEKLLIVPNASNTGYWIITHNNQESFYCFSLTATGLSNAPVISNVTSPQFNGAGHFKMNRTFDLLAMGSLFEGNIGLYPFNNATGVFGEPLEWNYTFGGSSLQYGMEFSPNGQVLYASNLERIIQYDLSSGDAATIEASAYTVFLGDFFNGTPASLQLAMDRKIYCNLGGGLGVIECPNFTGAACNWIGSAIPGFSAGGYGLNPWVYDIAALDVPLQASLSYTEECIEVPIAFQIDSPIAFDQININWGDGNTAELAGPQTTGTHTYMQPGDYTIAVEIQAGCEVISFDSLVTIITCVPPVPEVPVLVLQGDTCDVSAPLTAQVLLSGEYDEVTVDFGDTVGTSGIQTFAFVSADVSAQYVYSSPGEYTVCVRAIKEGVLDTTVCVNVIVGLCCEFELEVNGLCTELPSAAEVTGTNTVDAYAWSISTPTGGVINNQTAAPELALSEAGRYVWQVTLDGECGEVQLTQAIDKTPCDQEFCAPFVPNTFTPNNDGLNEVFAPVFGCGEVEYRLMIFNRWGEELFDSTTDGPFWNGGTNGYYVNDGVYYYVVEYATAQNVSASVSGHVTVVR